MKRFLPFCLLCALLLTLTACTDPVIGGGDAGETAQTAATNEKLITLTGDGASVSGGGVSVKDGVVTIGAPGDYILRGTLRGQLVVNLRENPGKVSLTLDGAEISCAADSALYAPQGDLTLILAPGSENRIVSGTEADLAAWTEMSSGAAVYAEDDLTIRGEGSLAVYGYLNNGLASKDDLSVLGGTITVLAANNGLRGSESVTVSGGEVSIEAGNDGVKSTSAVKEGKGFVLIEGGTLTVRAGGDALSAETELCVTDGTLRVETTGDPAAVSCKGLKARTALTVSGGDIHILAQDHAIRSQGALTVSGGSVEAVSRRGKGLSAETELLVSEGTLTVQSADDGLISASAVVIRGGEVSVRAGADGIQGGKKGTGFAAETGTVLFEGGRVLVTAAQKPVDAKAAFTLSGGTVFLCGNPASGEIRVESAVPCLRFRLSGEAGLSLRVDGIADAPELQAAYAFNTVLYADGTLKDGGSYRLKAGAQAAEAKAAR